MHSPLRWVTMYILDKFTYDSVNWSFSIYKMMARRRVMHPHARQRRKLFQWNIVNKHFLWHLLTISEKPFSSNKF